MHEVVVSDVVPRKHNDIDALGDFCCKANINNDCLLFLRTIIRCIYENFDSSHDILLSFNTRPDVICITETKINEEVVSNISLTGCSLRIALKKAVFALGFKKPS